MPDVTVEITDNIIPYKEVTVDDQVDLNAEVLNRSPSKTDTEIDQTGETP